MEAPEKRKLLVIMLLVALFVGVSVCLQELRLTSGRSLRDMPESIQLAINKQEITVNVTGAVKEPGLYRLPPESRAVDAIGAAGGLLPEADKDRVNLARRCSDGVNIQVPYKKTEGSARQPRMRTAAATADDVVDININSAGAEDLAKLPGIGPGLAKRIVSYREEYGAFKVPEQLKDVSGIGETKYEEIKDRIRI